MELRGMRYHPIDIETSVIRAHKSIMEWWVWFLQWLPVSDNKLNFVELIDLILVNLNFLKTSTDEVS